MGVRSDLEGGIRYPLFRSLCRYYESHRVSSFPPTDRDGESAKLTYRHRYRMSSPTDDMPTWRPRVPTHIHMMLPLLRRRRRRNNGIPRGQGRYWHLRRSKHAHADSQPSFYACHDEDRNIVFCHFGGSRGGRQGGNCAILVPATRTRIGIGISGTSTSTSISGTT
jgi:hypothetical protein